jgi:hypothetical protein
MFCGGGEHSQSCAQMFVTDGKVLIVGEGGGGGGGVLIVGH